MTTFFNDCNNPNEIKSLWKKLCHKHHPDIGGDVEILKQVNIQYHEALSKSHGQETTGTDEKQHTYYYNSDVEQVIIDKIKELIALQMADVEIELLGTWIWVGGDTLPYQKQLGRGTKEKPGLKLRWNKNRDKWCWSPPGSRKRRFNNNADFNDLRKSYGSKSYASKTKQAVTLT